jgi:hypothetical protein
MLESLADRLMPAAIALVATFAATLGTGAIGATAIFYGVSAALYLGIGIGLQFLSALIFKPSAPRPEDVQASLKQPAQPRVRHYGRVKVSGPWIFGDSKAGILYKLLALGEGPIDAIEQFWFDDKLCVLDGAGWMTNHWYGLSVNIKSRLGAVPETAYSELTGNFPEWTTAHRGDGVASLLARQTPVEQENFLLVFPNGANTAYRAVLRGAKVLNPVTSVTAWSDNAAGVIRDYMTHADGMRLPAAVFNTPLALAGWQASWNRATEDIPLKGGGTEDRYRLWGSYFLNERPADVLGRMLVCCDGRLWPTPDGGLALDIGQWAEPTVIVDEDMIVGFSDFSRGKDILTTANTIRATYLDPTQDYQTADADPWVDPVDVAERGEIELDTSFIMSPSHSQTRRLMKLAAWRANPLWVGTFQLNLAGLAAVGERLVRITYPPFSIDHVFEVQNLQLIVGEGNILQGVTIEVLAMPQTAYAWDPTQEQGDAPVSTGTTVDRTVPLPASFTFTQGTNTTAGVPYAYGILSFATPPAGLKVQGRYKKVSASGWLSVPIADGATSAQTGALDDGVAYEAQVRHTTATGRPGEWTPSQSFTATADAVSPGALTGVSLTGNMLGGLTLNFTTPGTANVKFVKIYRAPTGVSLNRTTHLVETLVVAINTTYARPQGDITRTTMVTNGTFTGAATGWTLAGGWTYGSDKITQSGAGGNAGQAMTFGNGVAYRTAFTISGWSASSVRLWLAGGTTVVGTSRGSNGTFLQTLTETNPTTNTQILLVPAGGFIGSIDDVVVYPQTGSCLTAGIYDIYAEPLNGSGVAGTLSGPYTVTII